MKYSSAPLALASLISVLGLIACSPDTSGEATTSTPGSGGAGTQTASSGGDGDGDGDTSTGQSSPTVSSGGDGDGGSTSSNGGAPGNGGSGAGGEPSGAGGEPSGAGGEPSGAGGDPGGAGGDTASSTATGAADVDGDGFTIDGGDCDDNRADINPDATEVCNTRDDDCDGNIDEGFDADGDTWLACLGDCDDNNAAVNPDQVEIGPNGLDDDCDGDTDGPVTDDDGDGYTENEGDCNDTDENVSPGSIEFPGNSVDDDCDGNTDEALESCDGALDPGNAMDYGRAIGLCNGELLSATFVSGVTAGRSIRTSYGNFNGPMNIPTEGSRHIHLSSGTADTSTKSEGLQFDNNGNISSCQSSPHPNRLADPGACGNADPVNVCDKTEISLSIRVPQNAQSFTYEFQFFTSEYPRWRCTAYDDTFLAMLSSQAVNGGTSTNISFDTLGKVVSVNNGFLQICTDAGGYTGCDTNPIPVLTQTGYYPFDMNTDPDENGSGGAAATVPLTTTSPVVPGETITLRFVIFDEGDDILDSSVLIDNFRWSLNPSDGPGTEPTN